jgi:polyphenol oxidase
LIHEIKANTQILFIGADVDFGAPAFSDQYAILLQRFPRIKALAYAEQVHGDTAIEVQEGIERLHFTGAGDALFTRSSGTALLIRTADCIPILFYSAAESLIGAVHAGWRGLQKNILTKTVKAAGATAADLQFVVGPFIRETSYEVGLDVADQFEAQFRVAKENGKFFLNLKAILHHEFSLLGVRDEQVTWHDTDTIASPGWYSARRGDQRRNLSLVFRE